MANIEIIRNDLIIIPLEADCASNENRVQVAEYIKMLLSLAAVDISDCVFSGYSDPEGMNAKENQRDFGRKIPDDASDDALLFFFADSLPDETTDDLSDPLWYASKDLEQAGYIFLDVLSKKLIDETVPRHHSDSMCAWLTEVDLKTVRIGTFALMQE